MYEAKKARNKKKSNIRFRQSLFWDVDPKTIDPKKHARYIIERVLDFGTPEEIRWLWNYYNHRFIYGVIRSSKVLHTKSRIFWELILDSEKEVWSWQKLIHL